MFVTGASKGIGLQTVLAGLKAGYDVAASSRNVDKLKAAVGEATESMENFLPLAMEFNQASIDQAIKTIMAKWGRIDVLVNNAGYAVLGAFEEFSMAEVKQNFEVNVFGLMQVTQSVLPIMRQQNGGRIINLASISGTVTGPGQSIYSATKAAVIMMSEALDEEAAEFNIHVTAICPSGVRTDFLDDRSMKRPAKKLAAYQTVTATMQGLEQLNHHQSGDPALVGQAILQVAEMAKPPKRLYLGNWSLAALQGQIDGIIKETNDHLDLVRSIDN